MQNDPIARFVKKLWRFVYRQDKHRCLEHLYWFISIILTPIIAIGAGLSARYTYDAACQARRQATAAETQLALATKPFVYASVIGAASINGFINSIDGTETVYPKISVALTNYGASPAFFFHGMCGAFFGYGLRDLLPGTTNFEATRPLLAEMKFLREAYAPASIIGPNKDAHTFQCVVPPWVVNQFGFSFAEMSGHDRGLFIRRRGIFVIARYQIKSVTGVVSDSSECFRYVEGKTNDPDAFERKEGNCENGN